MSYENRYCPNQNCPDYGKTGLGNIYRYCYYGSNQTELLGCRTCKKTFSSRHGTVFYNAKIPIKEVCEILKCLAEGNSIRATARIKGVTKKTVQRYVKLAGKHAKEVSEHLIKNLHVEECQLDELWSFIKKKEENLKPLEKLQGEYGDYWGHISFDPVTKMLAGYVLGKRTEENTDKLIEIFKSKTDGSVPFFTSDEYKPYKKVLLKQYGILKEFPKSGRRGRPRKPRLVPREDLCYATVEKHRQKGKVVRIDTKVIFGDTKEVEKRLENSSVSNSINISFIERNNLTIRQENGKLSRKTLSFSKKEEFFHYHFDFCITSYHFVRPHRGLRMEKSNGRRRWFQRTPAMAANITDHVWTMYELMSFVVPVDT